MTTTDKEKIEMKPAPTTNERLKTILLVLLIVLVVLLVLAAIVSFLMMSGMMGGWMRWMMGPHGQVNSMVAAYTNILRDLQGF